MYIKVKMKLLILPNTLFQVKHFPKDVKSVVIWEHPQYFTKYKYNKKRLVLHRASLKYYENMLDDSFEITYVKYDKTPKLTEPFWYFDPIDKIKLPKGGKKIQSPNFLLSDELLEEYSNKTDKFFFNGFYMWSKKKLNIIPKIKSQDKQNRKAIPSGTKISKLENLGKADEKFIREAETYVAKNFPNNYGTEKGLLFPVTHATAKRWLLNWIKKKFKSFGSYQDYTLKNENFLFHSCLSSSINIGLLNPGEIIPLLPLKPLNSYEGLIRQYFWREYQRYCYVFLKRWHGSNYFGNSKRLSKKWYAGNTGIGPVDDSIKDAFETGYLHHIRRLMIVANYMNLCGITHEEGRKWFTEFALDSYDWVMYQNIDMGFFASGGKTSRKPYISSSNYIIKMSNYKKGDWSEKWDELYRAFIKKHKKKLWKYRYHFPSLK
jgi:deoxyribodipyrimidine photolyase-related protein